MRVGVVGVGVMGSNHARVFAGLPGTELVGVADPDRKQAEFVARTLGCVAVGDVEELLDRDIDAITIAAPTHLHRDIALLCIARGVHVMVEKPIASSVEEGRDIINAARRAGVTLMVGHVERFQSCRRSDQGSDPRRGYPLDCDHPRGTFSTPHVERGGGDRPCGSRY